MNIDTSSNAMATGRPANVGGAGGPPPEIKAMWESRRAESSTTDSLSLSPMAEMFSSISAAEKTEMSDFRSSMIEAIQNGTFNAEEMAEQAPDALKDFAEQNDIDLTEQLQRASDQISQRSSFGSGERVQQGVDLSAYLNQDLDAVSSLFDALMESGSS